MGDSRSTGVRRSLSYYTILESIGKGLLVATVPGLHPMVYGRLEPIQLGIVHGSFTGMSLILAEKGIFHPDTASQGRFKLEEIAKGVTLGILLIPLAYTLYSFKIPGEVVLAALLLGALILLRSDPLAFLLSGIAGIVALRLPVNVADPLASGLFYLFGSLFLFGGTTGEERGDWKRGAVAALLTGYFPALPPSAWSRAIGGGSISVAAALTPIFSLVALLYGKTRSAMSAYIQYPDPNMLLLVGGAYVLSLLLVLSAAEILRLMEITLPEEAGAAIMLGHAIHMGPGNLLLLFALASLVYLTRSRPSAYFGYIVLPTVLYYT